ncbi:unnamed protein product [Alternaria alternata]
MENIKRDFHKYGRRVSYHRSHGSRVPKIITSARGYTLIYDVDEKGFQYESRNIEFQDRYSMDLFITLHAPKQQYINSTPHLPLHLTEPPTMVFLQLPLDDADGEDVPGLLQSVTDDWRSLLVEENHTSTTGSLICSQDKLSVSLETPENSLPYLYLSLRGPQSGSSHKPWRGIFAYKQEPEGETTWQESLEKFENYRYEEQKNETTIEMAPFDSLVCLVREIVEEYIAIVERRAKKWVESLNQLERALNEDEIPSLSALLREVNSASHQLRTSNLEEEFTFSMDAAEWVTNTLRPFNHTILSSDLLVLGRRMRRYHPDRLQEEIAELRTRITDIGNEQQRERDELRQKREDERQRRKDDRTKLKDELRKKREELEMERQQRKEDRFKLEIARQEQEDREREERENERRKQEREDRERENERQRRADARQKQDDDRAANEGKLLAQSIRIAEETQRDSRTMRGIAWVTIAFLPATFVSSFFGMNFFNGIAGNIPFDEASRNVWLFFVVAVPVSAIVLFTFYFWDKHEQMNDNLRLKGSKDENELRLMQAEMDYLMEENGPRYTL